MEVAHDRFNQIDYAFQRERLQVLHERWGIGEIFVEANAMGVPIIEELQRSGMPVTGFDTTPSSKPPLIENLALALERTENQFQADAIWTAELEASFPLAQAIKAVILVQLGRYDEAIVAADKALAIRSNTTAAFAAAYSNKGDALRHLGRIEEAKLAFAKAFELDYTFIPPDLDQATIIPTTPVKSPIGWITALIAICLVTLVVGLRYKRK